MWCGWAPWGVCGRMGPWVPCSREGQAGGMVGREMVKWTHRVKSGWTEVQLDGQDGEKGAR